MRYVVNAMVVVLGLLVLVLVAAAIGILIAWVSVWPISYLPGAWKWLELAWVLILMILAVAAAMRWGENQ